MPDLHPRNRGFQWRASAGPYERLTPAQAAQYDEQGFFLFEGAFTADAMDAVAAAIEPHERAGEAWLRGQKGGRHMIAKADAITFTIHLVARSETLRAFSRHPVFQGICRDTLGPGVRLYWDRRSTRSPAIPKSSPGTRTTATPTSSRSSI